MDEFIIFPAIDLRDGKVVRLKQGRGDEQTVYATSPELVALDFIDQGAEWLHLVNLNGAFGEATEKNESAIREIVELGDGKVSIQLGGGLRNLIQVETALSLGITRIIIGTAVIENPQFGIELLDAFGSEKLVFGLDVKGKHLMSRGWQSSSGKNLSELAQVLADAGAKTVIYTDIQKDGMQTGVDWKTARQLSKRTGMQVIAAGGVKSVQDIADAKSAGLAGIVIGRALYEGNFSLQEVLHVR
jgi:phosphoribosylformimino-5-aminoimidazole carboxamide ribotide isomerase